MLELQTVAAGYPGSSGQPKAVGPAAREGHRTTGENALGSFLAAVQRQETGGRCGITRTQESVCLTIAQGH